MLYVYTGGGKGKTSAALGTAIRALGYGWKVLMIQFIKYAREEGLSLSEKTKGAKKGRALGPLRKGEYTAAKLLGKNFLLKPAGIGFYGIQGDKTPVLEHKKAAKKAWQYAVKEIQSDRWDLIILDELNYALDYGFVSVQDVVRVLKKKPKDLNIIVTGNNAPKEIIEIADLVTEMRSIKHPFDRGIVAKQGLDY